MALVRLRWLRWKVAMLCTAVCFIIILMYTATSEKSSNSVDDGDIDQERPPHPPPLEREGPKKWIVITSILDVTDNIRRLSKLENWTVIVVGDRKSPKIWKHENCIFLDVTAQKKLQYSTHDHTPYNSYTRKNLGYLYAIEHGARFIYDTDDDNRPLEQHLQFDLADRHPGICVDPVAQNSRKASYWNPYAHFGRPDIWPRGYPLQKIQDQMGGVQLRVYRELKASAIQQGLVNNDPDVDAIYRIAAFRRRRKAVTFDSHAPVVQLAPGVYAPFNSQNTLFRYEAFWALYLPVSVAFRVCDIWRGYWALRLLAEIDETLSFYPANAVQYRNAHSYYHDFLDEKDLYEKAYLLVEDLHSWACENSTFLICALDLAQMMASKGYWGSSDVRGVELWFQDLANVGYAFPKLKPRAALQGNTSVFYASAAGQPRTMVDNVNAFANFCNLSATISVNSRPSASIQWARKLKTLALIIIFNFPWHLNIPVLQLFYQPHFANVIFCSTFSENEDVPFSFINLTESDMVRPPHQNRGGLSYNCIIRAMEMRMDVEGYVVMGDDVLYNFWNPFDVTQLNYGYYDTHWNNESFDISIENPIAHAQDREGIAAIADDMEYLSSLKPEIKRRLLDAVSHYAYYSSDFYYLPSRLQSDFLTLAQKFSETKVYVEVTLAIIFETLGWSKENNSLDIGYFWTWHDRQYILKYYRKGQHFLHAVKFSRLNELMWKNELCWLYGRAWIEEVSALM